MVRLEAKDISFAYDGGDVLRGIDLEVSGGEVVCVLGPNGAGKSTLLRLLAGLAAPRVGTVEIDGHPIANVGARERAQDVALVPQSLFGLPDLSVRQFVNQGRYAYRTRFGRPGPGDGAAVHKALADSDLLELAERRLDVLSGGQRQRALVARALAQEPRLVLVDEPTNSLDPAHQIRVFNVIAGLGCEGRSAVVVTHDLNLATQYASRIVLMDGGAIVADGSVHEVFRPEVLCPVYGETLAFGSRHVEGWGEERPYVLPWRDAGNRSD